MALLGDRGALTLRRVRLLAQARQDIHLSTPSRPRTVVFDPHGVLLKTLDFEKPAAEWIAQMGAELPLSSHLDAARALASIGGDDAVEALGKALTHHRFSGLRQVAAAGLAQIGSGAALAALERGTRDPDARVRALVFDGLGAFPDHHELIAPLGRALLGDESYNARSYAASALGHFVAYRAEVAPLLVKAPAQRSYLEEVAGTAWSARSPVSARLAPLAQAERLARYGSPMAVRSDAMMALAQVGHRSGGRCREERGAAHPRDFPRRS